MLPLTSAGTATLSCQPNSLFWVLQINQERPVVMGHFGYGDYVRGSDLLGGATDIKLAFILSPDAAIMTSE